MNTPKIPRWQAEPRSLWHMIVSALSRSCGIAVGVSVAFFAVRAIWLLFHTRAEFLPLFGQAGLVFAVTWAPLFALCLIGSSRLWSDRAFTISGFLATFFGLAILAIFGVRLADEVALWFRYTPELVERANREHQQTIDAFAQMKKTNEEKLATLLRERDEALKSAATDAEKKEHAALFEFGIKDAQENLDQDARQMKEIAESSLRPDVSKPALLWAFLSNSANARPQDAGIAPALLGSIWLGVITVLFAVPIGVGAALYLEEYGQTGWLARLIQININNLAGVPSVVYGILGGFVFVYLFRELHEAYPRVAVRNLLGGGLTLGLLTMPVIIVATQEAVRAVPASLREGAYALGATKWQIIWNIVLPMARPGIATGTILALSRAIGEAAPLVFLGGKMFVDQTPLPWTPFTALPLQIFNWCERPPLVVPGADGGEDVVDMWKYNAAVASTVLLIVLLGMNAVAIFLRNRAQRKLRY